MVVDTFAGTKTEQEELEGCCQRIEKEVRGHSVRCQTDEEKAGFAVLLKLPCCGRRKPRLL